MNSRPRWCALLGAALLCAAACEPGKTHVLGRVPDMDDDEPDAEADDDRDRDAGRRDAASAERDASARDDAALTPCWENDDCDSRERPYCSAYFGHCVECTRDRHCGDTAYWYCSDRNGTCVDERTRN